MGGNIMAGPQDVSTSNNVDIDALLTLYKWDTTSISFSFPDSGWWYVLEQVFDELSLLDLVDVVAGFVDDPTGSLINLLIDTLLPFGDTAIVGIIALNGFEQFNAAQQDAARFATANFAAVAQVTFNEVEEGEFDLDIIPFLDGDGVGVGFTHGVIRFAETDSTSAPAFGIPPLERVETLIGNGFLGDTWFDNDGRFDAPVLGSFGHFTIMHELGHAMGLKHGHESGLFGTNVPQVVGELITDVNGPILPADKNSIQFSIMTYRAALNGPDTLTAQAGNFAQSLMMLDIQALQYMYGANYITNASDTTYWFDADSGEMKVNNVSNGTPGINKLFLTIWDGNGVDTYDFSDYSANLTVDLAPGSWSNTTQAQLADLGGNGVDQFAKGNVYNALLANGDVRSLIENATGGAGNDTIRGNGAANLLRGGGGTDTLFGLLGADTLEGGDGNDNLDGGADNDTLRGGGGDDTLTGAEGNDNLDGGADNDTLLAGAGNDTLAGGSGNDTLNGGTGDDTMSGNAGDDTYTVDSLLDQVIEAANEGIDTIRTAIGTFTIPDNVENLEFTGIGPLTVMGNDSDNRITGNIGNDIIAGAGGNDTLTGNNGHDTLSGDAGNDQLFGGAGNDLLDGGADDDLVEGGSGDDQADGGTGNDTVRGGANNDYVDGGDGNDGVSGDEGNDQVSGGAGNDTVWGGSGNDQADGGLGDDTVYGESGDDQANGGDGDDFVSGGANNDYVDGGIGDDTVSGDEGNDQVSGGEGDDHASGGSGNDQVDGGAGNDVVAGGSGNDQVDGSDGDDTVTGDEGDDAVTGGIGNDIVTGGTGIDSVDGGDGDDTVSGDEGDDAVTGGAGLDLLAGGDGNDNVSGGTGNDDITGGAGNDVISAGDGDDTIREGGGSDKIDGGAGNDTVTYAASTVGVVFSPLAYGLYGDALGDQLLNIETLIGTNFADVLYLDTADNKLYGLAGNDKLYGLAGNDFLDGGTGADAMAGGTGDDVYIVDNVGDAVTELNYQGRDRIETDLNAYQLGLYVEDLTFIGTGNFTGIGNSLNNVIIGGAGTDTLRGEGGDDTLNGLGGIDAMCGGTGNDTYFVDNTSDKAIENRSEGTDIVFSSATYTLSANVENLTLLGSGNINGTGNDLANVLVGNSGNNQLDGSTGADTMSGLGGDDTYAVDNSWDKVFEAVGGGVDTVNSSVSYALLLGQAIENLILTGTANNNATGNEFVNTITGNVGKNTLDGGGDADVLIGLAGDDVYVIDNAGDQTVEASTAGSGYDTVKSTVTWTLTANTEALCLLGSANIDGTGNELANLLVGNSGKNILNGGLNADFMQGEGGDDTYVVENSGDKVLETSSSGGADLVQSAIAFTLGSNLENLTLTGALNINGTGNSLANMLTGNSGNNLLDGSGGADTISGLGGNDTYLVDHSSDKVFEAVGGGTDTVKASVSYALLAGQDVENLVLIGSSDLNATGNEFANAITGTSGRNVIDGAGGADLMTGLNGDDTYFVDDLGDVVVEAAGGGWDTVKTALNYSLLGTNLESLVLLGSSNINATGSASANTLIGNAGDNVLDGGTGADTMQGNNGDDTYLIDNSSDKVIEGSGVGSGVDSVISTVTFSLVGQAIEKLTLNGIGNINATGNTLANDIVGNGGANRLEGDLGNDNLTGGGGADAFVFNTGLNALSNVDHIMDFSVVDDTIYLENAVFKAFSSGGPMAASAFNIGSAAADSSDRITYDSVTGALYYDSNGNAAGNSIQFATLAAGLALTASDFYIV